MVAKSGKYNRENNIFNDFPPNENDYKGQAIFLKKSLQFFFGEVVEFMRYSRF